MKKIFTFLIIISISMVIVTACNPFTKKMTNDNISTHPTTIKKKDPEEGGFAFNFSLENNRSSDPVIKLNEKEPYKANIELINYFQKENNFKAYIFDNGKLIKVNKGSKIIHFLDFPSLKNGVSLKQSFEISNLKKGKHELMYLVVRNPEQRLYKAEFKDFVNFVKRTGVIVGESEEQLISPKIIDVKNSATQDTKLTYVVPFGEEIRPENAITLKKVKQNYQHVNLSFWNDSPNKLYSIILLDNNKQISLDNSLYKIERVGSTAIDLKINLSKQKVHNLVFVIVSEPGIIPDVPSKGIQTTNKITIIN